MKNGMGMNDVKLGDKTFYGTQGACTAFGHAGYLPVNIRGEGFSMY